MPQTLRPRKPQARRPRGERKPFHRLIENDLIRRVTFDEYRDKVQRVYGGPKGALLAVCSTISLHVPLGKRLFSTRKFDLRGARRVLDIGSGAGQLAGHVLSYAEADAKVVCIDLSHRMLCRARTRLEGVEQKKSRRRSEARAPWRLGNGRQHVAHAAPSSEGSQHAPQFVAGDLARLPFADGSFDCLTCGYVLEHLPDPGPGLAEMARVLERGGRMLLLATEDSFSGAWTSRLWYCRTYNRAELKRICSRLGLEWRQELWFTPVHKAIRAGGICVEIVKR